MATGTSPTPLVTRSTLRRLRAGRGPLRAGSVRIVAFDGAAPGGQLLRSPSGRYLYRVHGALPVPGQPYRLALGAPRREVG